MEVIEIICWQKLIYYKAFLLLLMDTSKSL